MASVSREPVGSAARQLRVVHVCKVKGIAGAERHLLQLLPAMGAHGVDARLIVIDDSHGSARAFCKASRCANIPVETVVSRHHIDPTLVGRLAARLRSLEPDLVHTHLFHADLYGLPAARRAGIAATISSRHDNNPFRRRTVFRWLTRRAMRDARRVVAISEALARFARDEEGVPEAAIVPIYYGLHTGPIGASARRRVRAALGYMETDRLVGFVGRLVEQKGVDVLLDAFPAILARHTRASLVIVGDGPLRPRLYARAARLGIGAHVRFMGWIEQAVNVMPAWDVAAMPSRWEGLGLAALEAMACGCPLAASRVDALPELVQDGTSGLLVPPGNPPALAAAVNALLDDPGRARQFGEAARERVRQSFSVERMARATLQVYAQVLAETRAC